MWVDDEHLDALLVAQGNTHAVCFPLSRENVERLNAGLQKNPFCAENMPQRGPDVRTCMLRIRRELEQCCLVLNHYTWTAGGIVLTQDELTRILLWCYAQRRTLLSAVDSAAAGQLSSPAIDVGFLQGVAQRLYTAHSALFHTAPPQVGVELASMEACERLSELVWVTATSSTSAAVPLDRAPSDQLVQPSAPGAGERSAPQEPSPASPRSLNSFLKPTEVEWLSISGRRGTLTEFLTEMETVRASNGFSAEYDNLFLEHKQMPSLVLDTADSNSFGLLLRIPDLSDEYGTSITTITNRVCFMVHRTARLVVTYHACEEDPFDGFQREWEAGRHASTGIERIAETMIRRVLRTYNKGVAALREAVDELESREPGAAARRLDDTARVQRLSLIAKKSAVYKRCADATRETLAELEDVDWMEPFAKTLCDGLSTVASMTDELASNALASIDLTIALSEFKSNTNLKNFTYMSILLQPVGIATSWYGMNWAHMPELEYENAYYIFAGATWVVALLVFTRFVLRGMFLDAHKPTEPFAVHTAVAGATVDADGSAAECRPWRRASHVLPLVPHGGQQSRRATVSLLLDKADTCVTFRSSGAFPPESSLVEDDVQDVTVADVGPQHAEVSPSYPCDDASDVVFELNPLALHSKP